MLCLVQAKARYFDRYARPIPKHNFKWHSFTNALAKHQVIICTCLPPKPDSMWWEIGTFLMGF